MQTGLRDHDQGRNHGEGGPGLLPVPDGEGEAMPSIKDMCTWARTKKRITTYEIKKRWGVDDDKADEIYNDLKHAGVVGRMGYVTEVE